jgi:hypothetical protein
MPSLPSSQTERRAWPRRRNRYRVFLADSDESQTKPHDAWIVDRSPGGLRLAIAQEIETGTILRIRPIAAPANMDWVNVQVRNCRPQESGWELGCKFVESPPLPTLLLFG